MWLERAQLSCKVLSEVILTARWLVQAVGMLRTADGKDGRQVLVLDREEEVNLNQEAQRSKGNN